jgi:hypothetical protein
MAIDRYPELGPKRRLPSVDDCLTAVRLRFPNSQVEGSKSLEQRYWNGRELIAHSWPVKGNPKAMWLRMRGLR